MANQLKANFPLSILTKC